MTLSKLFPRLLFACLTLSFAVSTTTQAQTEETRLRRVAASTTPSGVARLENDAVIISLADDSTERVVQQLTAPLAPALPLLNFNQMLLAAIEQRLGAPYVLGASGNRAFDCSGFVWSVFQSAGVNFDRTNARTLWQRFEPASLEDQSKFGTLIFFNNLGHVGIVADEGSFYHASSSQGVIRSPLNRYWLSRLDGFRRVRLPSQLLAE